jgi:membrane-associated protease RseP (regulator of RpoE activity)
MRSPDATLEAAPEEVAQPDKPTFMFWRLAALIGGLAVVGFMWPRVFLVIMLIAVIIFLHELGHYTTARISGMKVTEFFLGMGPRIWSFRRGETEYGIKAIPAVAYVRIIGMSNVDEIPPEDEARTYRQQPFWQRVMVAGAGSAMHFTLALLMLFALYVGVGRQSAELWVVNSPSPGSAAQIAGIEAGDTIVSVDGVAVSTHDEMATEVRQHPEETVALGVERDGELIDVPVLLGSRTFIVGTIGEDLSLGAYDGVVAVNSVRDDSAQGQAGLVDGDQVVSINGVAVTGLGDLDAAVDASADGVLELSVVGIDGDPRSVSVDLGDEVDVLTSTGFLGVGQDNPRQRLGVVDSATGAVGDFGSTSWAVLGGLGQLFNPSNLAGYASSIVDGSAGEASVDEPTSARETDAQYLEDNQARPVSIIGVVGLGSQTETLAALLAFLAGINIVIGIINLIPLLPFDGGHISVAIYEKIRELANRDGKRYFADVNKLMPLAIFVIVVMVSIGILGATLDIVDPLKI